MMFSSNQVLEISGSMEQLPIALQFALDYSDHARAMTPREKERGCKLVYQIAKNGKYCVGWGFERVPNGWQEYQFDFEVDIVSRIIAQYLYKMETPESGYEWADGGDAEGFLMKVIDSSDGNNIENSFYGIVSFEKFNCFYAK